MAFSNNKEEEEKKKKKNSLDLSLEDVRNNNHSINDPFNKIWKEIGEKAKDKSEFDRLLTERILKGFILSFIDANKQKQQEKESANVASSLGVDIPKKKRKVPADTGMASRGRENKGLEDENKGKKKPRRPEKQKKNTNATVTIPEMPQEFKDCIEQMNGTDVMFVIQKKLTKSDVTSQQNRLLIPIQQIHDEQFLKEEEKIKLENDKIIAVSLIEPSLNVRKLNMRKWSTSGSYSLISEWIKVVRDNEEVLKEDNMVQLWSFRQGLELCFALIDGSGASASGGSNGNEGVVNGASTSQSADTATTNYCSRTINH